mmetsp:Transcript_46133/g.142143  ORF Transcript_46133/g.142143 Transcript_46133/m.142143 type:complete len:278 (+) Transcript_46133:142-975(+)
MRRPAHVDDGVGVPGVHEQRRSLLHVHDAGVGVAAARRDVGGIMRAPRHGHFAAGLVGIHVPLRLGELPDVEDVNTPVGATDSEHIRIMGRELDAVRRPGCLGNGHRGRILLLPRVKQSERSARAAAARDGNGGCIVGGPLAVVDGEHTGLPEGDGHILARVGLLQLRKRPHREPLLSADEKSTRIHLAEIERPGVVDTAVQRQLVLAGVRPRVPRGLLLELPCVLQTLLLEVAVHLLRSRRVRLRGHKRKQRARRVVGRSGTEDCGAVEDVDDVSR